MSGNRLNGHLPRGRSERILAISNNIFGQCTLGVVDFFWFPYGGVFLYFGEEEEETVLPYCPIRLASCGVWHLGVLLVRDRGKDLPAKVPAAM